MKKIMLFIVLAALCPFSGARAQDNSQHLPVNVGGRMPDVRITHIINARYRSAKLSDYRGKLVILDFWSSWCSSCIAGFPELNALQKRFAGRIQVFLVNPARENDAEKSVRIVIDRVNAWSDQRLALPVVLQDTAITRCFRFRSVPHCVWIGPGGVVAAITGKDAVSAENVTKILNGEDPNLPLKDDYAH
ncbi:MAG: TlpA family protein disulfide reductase [Sphingobacteriales bacterium]